MQNKKIAKIILLVGLVLVCAVAFSPKVLAITASELQEQIALLLAQVKQLQEQLAQLQNNQGVAWCHSFNANLRIGDTGDEVYALQMALTKEFGKPAGNMDNAFDEFTASDVVEFQEKYASEILAPYKLKRGTGFVGKSTRAKLNKLYGCDGNAGGGGGGVACTADAKQCPDGSYVSRTGPNCEFAKCPAATTTICMKEGEGSTQPDTTRYCCSGLTMLRAAFEYNDSCVATLQNTNFYYNAVCTYCGNGVCGAGENKCNCPSDCGTATTTANSVAVISPNGGETFTIGKYYTIQWTTTGLVKNSSVTIALRDTRHDANLSTGEQTIVVANNSGSSTWIVPEKLGDMTLGAGNVYRIVIYATYLSGETKADTSDNYFSIVSAASTTCTDTDGGLDYYTKGTVTINGVTSYTDSCSSIENYAKEYSCEGTGDKMVSYLCPNGCYDGACKALPATSSIYVMAPNGGEVLSSTSAYAIKWQAINTPSTSKLNIDVIDQTYCTACNNCDECTKAVSHGIANNTGEYLWSGIKSFLTGDWKSFDRFKISIQEVKSIGAYGAKDESDSTFTIY